MIFAFRKLNRLIREELEPKPDRWSSPVITEYTDKQRDDFKQAILKAINIVVLANNNNPKYGSYSDEEITQIIMDAAKEFSKK